MKNAIFFPQSIGVLLMLVVVALCVLLGIIKKINRLWIKKRGKECEGIVTEIDYLQVIGLTHIKVEYFVSGKKYKKKFYVKLKYSNEDRLKLFYNPKNPKNVCLSDGETSVQCYYMAFIFLFMAFILLIFAFGNAISG